MSTTATKSKPILFSDSMVRAILDGSKTQTRRVVKPQPPHSCTYAINGARSHAICMGPNGLFVPPTATSKDHRLACPYGAPGDELWVRECWGYDEFDDGQSRGHRRVVYRADNGQSPCDNGTQMPWRPSIHMPRSASRLTLRIEDIRVERVQEISEEDAIAEGVPRWANEDDIQNGHYLDRPLDDSHWCPTCQGVGLVGALGPSMGYCETECTDCDTATKLFRNLWDSINGSRPGCSWADNPFVWVVTFSRINKDSNQ